MPPIAQTIQLSVAPVFLLVATGGILNVTVGRLARVVDRSRHLQALYRETEGAEHQRVVTELRGLDRRMNVVSASIALCVACGVVVCLMVSMLFLVGSASYDLAVPISLAFILAMLLLMSGLLFFLYEVRLAMRNINVPLEYLELSDPRRRRGPQP